MKTRVLQNKCGGVGICVKTCPNLFRFQEGSKKAAVLLDRVPSGLEKNCLKAADSCPNKAIVVLFEQSSLFFRNLCFLPIMLLMACGRQTITLKTFSMEVDFSIISYLNSECQRIAVLIEIYYTPLAFIHKMHIFILNQQRFISPNILHSGHIIEGSQLYIMRR